MRRDTEKEVSSGQNDSDKEAVQIKKKEQEKENVEKNQKNHMQRSIYVVVYRWMYDISKSGRFFRSDIWNIIREQ